MRIMIYVLHNQEVGYGHWYRALALAEAAETRGHQVVLLSDKKEPSQITVWIDGKLNMPRVAYALARYQPDWLLYDVPWRPEAYLVQAIHDYNCRVGWLDAGPDDDPACCDLLWVQDDPARVILRTSLHYARYEPDSHWLVFGGAADKLGLVPRFAETIDEPAWLITSASNEIIGRAHGNHTIFGNPSGMVSLERHARKACLAMGQTAWECAALGVPIYLFALDQKHRATALKMAALGYAHTWGEVGLPPEDAWLRTFLAHDFKPDGPPIAGGAENLLNLLEEQR